MSKKILIVDDSGSIREILSFTLENAGYNIAKAKDGKDALKQLEETEYDLIITDMHMPEMDGLELIREIRKIEKLKYVPILFLTTESQSDIKMKAREAGATGWIIKPFVPEKLIRGVEKVLK